MKILMVCLGNICRSPLAEGIMRHKIEQRNLDWEIDSAGTSFWHAGEPPDIRSIEIAQKMGINISNQRARQFEPKDFERFDLILVMDSSNYQDVIRQTYKEEQKEKVELIMNFVRPGYNQNVPDPYLNNEGFAEVFDMLERACEKIIEQYVK